MAEDVAEDVAEDAAEDTAEDKAEDKAEDVEEDMAEDVTVEAVETAASLNSVGFNVARSLGPAIGGFLVALWGAASAFALNAVSFVGISAVLARWQAPEHAGARPREGSANITTSGAWSASRSAAPAVSRTT